MSRKVFLLVAVLLAASAVAPGIVRAADFSGRFDGEKLSVVVAPDHDSYAGEIRLGDKHFPLKARAEADHLTGSFTAPAGTYDFTATLKGDDLTLVTGRATYVLHRQATQAAVNPLDAGPAPAQNASTAPATAPAGALADYVVVNEIPSGKALTRLLPGTTTTLAALQATFPDLARYFEGRPQVLGAYEDQKDHKTATVDFAARLNGEPVKGLVSARVAEKGASVLVMYCKADASPAEWSKLMARPAAGKADGGKDDIAAIKAAAAEVPLKTYNFPDGTGSVGVAEGWTTHSPTLGGTEIDGPADQKVFIGVGAEVITPDSFMVKLNEQMAMNARRWGGPPPPPINMIIAPWSPDPVEALKNLIPGIAVLKGRAGLPTNSLEQIVQSWKIPALTPTGTAALILADVTRTWRGTSGHFRLLVQLEIYPLGQGTWGFQATQVVAPKDTFRQDLPVMLAQSMSVKENAAVIERKTREEIDAANQRFAAMQAANKQLQQAYDAQHKDWEHNQLIHDRTNANWDEIIRGYRTVEDTSTGDKTSVDLGNVDRVVDRLNAYDPGRYKQIPLRDELYPLPGRNGN